MKTIKTKITGKEIKVDDDWYEMLSLVNWALYTTMGRYHYAESKTNKRNQKTDRNFMHRLIMDPPKGMVVDHINGDGLDNRVSNLRVCTPAENSRNTIKSANASSRFKGIHWDNESKKWRACISIDGVRRHIGRFPTEKDAAEAYNIEAVKRYGKFAKLNEI